MGDGKMRLKIPDMFRDPYTFEGIISKYEEIIREVSEIDMSRVSFIEPYSMVSFLLMGRSCFRKRGEKIKLLKTDPEIIQQSVLAPFLVYVLIKYKAFAFKL